MTTQKWYYQATALLPDKTDLHYSGVIYATTVNNAKKKLRAAAKEIGAKVKECYISIYPVTAPKGIGDRYRKALEDHNA